MMAVEQRQGMEEVRKPEEDVKGNVAEVDEEVAHSHILAVVEEEQEDKRRDEEEEEAAAAALLEQPAGQDARFASVVAKQVSIVSQVVSQDDSHSYSLVVLPLPCLHLYVWQLSRAPSSLAEPRRFA